MPKTIRQRFVNLAARMYNKLSGNSLAQGENTAAEGEYDCPPATSEMLRRAAAEGAVLLKNQDTLPLTGKFALFGRVQIDTFYTGYGSGGNVLKPYAVSILDGLKRAGANLSSSVEEFYRGYVAAHPAPKGSWGNWPFSFPEPDVPEQVMLHAVQEADTAVVVIGRAAGEDRESELIKGSFYLTDAERRLLERVTKSFPHVAVVLNIGNLIDFSFLSEYEIDALLLVWQGGMETGNAVADLLLGKRSPCGKLPDTVALAYDRYPARNFGNARFNQYAEDVFVGYRYFETFARDDVLFPFGFGLSYTTFTVSATYDDMHVRFRVRNTGKRAGRETVQVYVKKPSVLLANPARELVGFRKTPLLPADGETFGDLYFDDRSFASYDESKKAYVMYAGRYEIFVGTDVRSATPVGGFTLEMPRVVEQLSEQAAPKRPFRVLADNELGNYCAFSEKNLKAQILEHLPEEIAPSGDRGITLGDVKAGRAPLDRFVAQLTAEELEALSRGDFHMDSPLGAAGNAGVLGGVTKSLRQKGVPAVTATDGPSGIRLKASCSLVPIGTLLCATFDESLIFGVYAAMGREMRERGSHVLLAPAMNLHRNPLGGRNFEYFSEDPYLAGKMAAAAVRGLQSEGGSACPKHFACNNQEFNRNRNDSRVSERALRELYLRAFEICVKEGKPRFLMTSYNKINGVWAHYHYELIRGILRGEWGFDGCVITDWWMRPAKSPEFKNISNNAYRIRAGVNVLMPGGKYVGKKIQGGSPLKQIGKEEGFTLAELQQNAMEVLRAVMHTSAFKKPIPDETKETE